MNTNLRKTALLLSITSTILFSCKKDEDTEPEPPGGYTVPTTYNFTNVNYSGQIIRLTMLDSISEYMKHGNSGMILNATAMKDMYANIGNPFGNSALDTSGKQLKNKTYTADQSYFDGLFDSLAIVSQSGSNTGADGVAGIVTSTTDPSKKYLLNRNGIEYAQVIKKQLMGAVFYYQAIENYLTNLPTDDNATVVTNEGTAMEHHCDEAFGYLGIPIDFPTNTTELMYWGEYINEVNDAISCSAPLMNAFLKLRAAISNKDYTTRDAQIIIVKEQWERVVAASAILEMTEAKEDFADNAIRNHVLSEAVGFINALKYNSNKKIEQSQIDAALTSLGSNFYNITISNINNAIDTINSAYGFDLNNF